MYLDEWLAGWPAGEKRGNVASVGYVTRQEGWEGKGRGHNKQKE